MESQSDSNASSTQVSSYNVEPNHCEGSVVSFDEDQHY
jgi:hypothetical protein